jgi:hypothetical protein
MDLSEKLIAVVGPCGAGKTTLVQGLKKHGLRAREIAQEHSFAPRMWRVITDPDILIFLHATFETCSQRKNFNWTPPDHQEQLRRLADARRNADVFISTDGMDPAEVLRRVLEAGALKGADKER